MNKEDQNEMQCPSCMKFFPKNSEHYCSALDTEVELKESDQK